MSLKWDMLIKGGMVFDGSGDFPVQKDIALKDGVIAAHGETLNSANAEQVIEVQGQWVMPGLVDVHTHYDLEVEITPGLPESVRHGTTTVVMSNCSLGLAFGGLLGLIRELFKTFKYVKTRPECRANDSTFYVAH